MLLHKNILPLTATVLSAAVALLESVEPWTTVPGCGAEDVHHSDVTGHTQLWDSGLSPVQTLLRGSNQSRCDVDRCLLDVFLWWHSHVRTLWQWESVHSDTALQLPFKVAMRPQCFEIDDVWSRACVLATLIFSGSPPQHTHRHTHTCRHGNKWFFSRVWMAGQPCDLDESNFKLRHYVSNLSISLSRLKRTPVHTHTHTSYQNLISKYSSMPTHVFVVLCLLHVKMNSSAVLVPWVSFQFVHILIHPDLKVSRSKGQL